MAVNLNPVMLPPNNDLAYNRSVDQISSGQRINSAADDAAGSAIAERFTAGINGIGAATQNIGTGMSLLETRSGQSSEFIDQLQRMRDLAVQAGNSTLSAGDVAAIDNEFAGLRDTILERVDNATFNGQSLFRGEEQTLQTGPDPGQTTALPGSTLSSVLEEQDFGQLSLSEAEDIGSVIDRLDSAQAAITDSQVQDGAAYNQLAASAEALTEQGLNETQARSRLVDTEIAQVASNLTQQSTQEQASLLIQSQANAGRQDVLKLLSS